MTADEARFRTTRIMTLARGTVLQGRLWALSALCKGEKVFMAALHLAPQMINQALKRALAQGRKCIRLADIKGIIKAKTEVLRKTCQQFSLF